MTTPYVEALRQFRAAVRAALNIHDPDKSSEANARARRDALNRAREVFAAQIPAAVDPSGPSRAELLHAHRPSTADTPAATAASRAACGGFHTHRFRHLTRAIAFLGGGCLVGIGGHRLGIFGIGVDDLRGII